MGNNTVKQSYLCLLSLTRAQLAGSRVWLRSCSHMPTVMTPALLSAVFWPSFLRPHFTGFPAWITHMSWMGRRVGGALSPHRRQWQEEEEGEKEMRRRGMNWFWVSKRLIKTLPSSESLQAVHGARLLSSSLGNETFKRKVEAKQLKLD